MQDVFYQAWPYLTSYIKLKWNKLTPEDLNHIQGNFCSFVNVLQIRYGYSRKRAAQEIKKLHQDTIKNWYKVHSEEPSLFPPTMHTPTPKKNNYIQTNRLSLQYLNEKPSKKNKKILRKTPAMRTLPTASNAKRSTVANSPKSTFWSRLTSTVAESSDEIFDDF